MPSARHLTLHVSHYMPEDHGSHVDFIEPWARSVEALAGGAVHVAIHSGASSFGKLENQFGQVIGGAVDVAHSPAALPAGRFPLTSLVGLPFLATGSATGGAALHALFDRFLEKEFAGLKVLVLHADSGAVLHTRDRPVNRIEDLAGLRLRCAPGIMADALACVGAVPVPLPPPQVRQAVADGVVDGAVMAWDVLAYTQTQDILRFHADTPLYAAPLYFVMNAGRYLGLPDAVRAAVDAASQRLASRFPAWWTMWERHGRALADAPGHTVYELAPAEWQRWRSAAIPAVTAHLDRLSADGVADAHAAFAAAEAAVRQSALPANRSCP